MISLRKRISMAIDIIAGKEWVARSEEKDFGYKVETTTAIYWVESAEYYPTNKSKFWANSLYRW